MPGTITFKPIEANLTHDTDFITKMNPYCAIEVGDNKVTGEVCKKGGKHPHWNDAVTLPIDQESKALVQLMDKARISHDDNIGSFTMDLDEVQRSGKVSKWYPLYYKSKNAGEILMEAEFQAEDTDKQKSEEIQPKEQNRVDQSETSKKEETVVTSEPKKRERRPVEFTMIRIEVDEPEIVPQEIIIIRPNLATRPIQKTEDNKQKVEAQSFTEKIVIAKEVDEVQPVTVKKTEEPVNATQTASKEVHEPVALDEKITATAEGQGEGLKKEEAGEKEKGKDEMNISQGLSKLENNTFVADKRDRACEKSPEKEQKIVDDLI